MAERQCELGDFKKVRVNNGTDNDSLKGFPQESPLPLTDPHHMVNQTICFTRPSCSIQILMVDVINIAANRQMFMTLTGKLSSQRMRRSAVDFLKKRKNHSLSHPLGDLGVTYALHLYSSLQSV